MEEYDTESHVNKKNFEACSTLARAIESHDIKLLQILVKYGMDVNDLNEHKRTALHELFMGSRRSYLNNRKGYITSIDELCEKGIDIDCQDSHKQTSLHLTVLNCLEHGTSTLLSSGADINVTDCNGRTPITLLLTGDIVNEKISEMFIKHLRKIRVFKVPIRSQNKALDNEFINHQDPESFNSNIIREFEISDGLKKMKNIILKENVTLHDIMYMDPHQLIFLVENDALVSVLESKDFHEKFPEFGGILKLKYRIASRKKAINSARKTLYSILKMRIPETCTEIVASCLNNKDLEALAGLNFK
ncbi:hypothetical protein QAD02_011494 [Eretmocerus hayati]|uniref:Uncharacterized protein n=1 Tax=Eretmocerus hayati TaxID=131215 RepID=A0ACC2NXX5_9HYME|nr:hypothetical protein QAD02_011494 [Eretmocerus hayati]